MDFGKRGLQKKINELESSTTRMGRWAGVTSVRVVLILAIAVIILAACLIIGAYRGIIAGTPSISDVNIMPLGYATFIYDSDGNELQKLNTAEGNRVSVSIDEIPENMQHAIVAIEDSRFYQHNGVDPVGMVRALAVAVSTGFNRTEGASTITQQLLKNNVFTNWTEESGFERITRKLQEQTLATQLEAALTAEGLDAKSVILENYLNTVNFGAGAYGVQTAARTYFGKDCTELTLSECAVLAAIPQNPTQFNPFIYPEENQERQQTVLEYMLNQGYISESEYRDACNDDVYSRISEIQENESEVSPYSYFIDELITRVENDLMERKGYTEVQAFNAVYSGGLKIYSTENSYIQSVMEEEFKNPENFPEHSTYALDWALSVQHSDGELQHYSREMLQLYFRNQDPEFDLLFDSEEEAQSYVDQYKEAVILPDDEVIAERFTAAEQPQAAMTVIDPATGHVLGIIGGRGEKTASLTLNRATDTYRQPGSTFKILSTYGPALELGVINLSTKILDEPYTYKDGTPVNNSDRQFHGLVTIRDAIINSFNVIAIKTITQITPATGFKYLTKLGFKNLIDDEAWDVRQPLALGGVTNGVSTLELAAAYAAIANKGVYTEPVFYTKVVNANGEVLLENEPESRQVFHESTAFLLTSAMMDVVLKGTGHDFMLDNMSLAGKTGTTNSFVDLVFAGFTPYYTAAIWAGVDISIELPEEYRNYHKKLWCSIMNRIHSGKQNRGFEIPSSVVSAHLCSDSGLLAGIGCTPVLEYFDRSQVPKETCIKHIPTPTPAPTPIPTPTIKPTVTAKPTKSETPTPTKTPKPTKSPAPTSEPTKTPAPEPTATPEPTKTPKPTEEPTAEPTKTPKPTKTPEPTEEPTPEPTEKPTKTPKPTEEPTAAPTEEPTKTPKPTKTPRPTEEPSPEPTEEAPPDDEHGGSETGG